MNSWKWIGASLFTPASVSKEPDFPYSLVCCDLPFLPSLLFLHSCIGYLYWPVGVIKMMQEVFFTRLSLFHI